MVVEKDKEYPNNKIKDIEFEAIQILKEIREGLQTMGDERREKYMTIPTHKNLFAAGTLNTIEDFLERAQKQENEHIIYLINSAYHILNESTDNDIWDKDHEAMYTMLEKIVQLGARRKGINTLFEQVTAVSAAMMQGDFSKRMDLTADPRLGDHNLFNYFTNVFNMVNEELQQKELQREGRIPKSIVQAIVRLHHHGKLVLAVDTKGEVTFVSNFTAQLYNVTKAEIQSKNIREYIVNFDDALKRLQHRGNLIDHYIEWNRVGDKKVKTAAFLTAVIAYDDDDCIDGYVFDIKPLPVNVPFEEEV